MIPVFDGHLLHRWIMALHHRDPITSNVISAGAAARPGRDHIAYGSESCAQWGPTILFFHI
jgi:hypothetical protein